MKCSILLFVSLFVSTSLWSIEVYVDPRSGDDGNSGAKDAPFETISRAYTFLKTTGDSECVIKLNSGIHAIPKPIMIDGASVDLESWLSIEATVLPDDENWTPEQMPVLVPTSMKGDIPIAGADKFTTVFVVQRNRVMIRGLKFTGYPYPNVRFVPINRTQKGLSDLRVEQCMFIAGENNPIVVGVLADGGNVQVDHCVFYNAMNGVVFWRKHDEPIKRGNKLTNSVIYGAREAGVWTADADADFVFKNNIVTNCNRFWIKNHYNEGKYRAENCIVVDNENHQCLWTPEGKVAKAFDLEELNLTKIGHIQLVRVEKIDPDIPHRYLHVVPETLGYELGAGLFKGRGK